jgi:hypothetical protein
MPSRSTKSYSYKSLWFALVLYSPSSNLTPTSSLSSPFNVLPSLKYTHSPSPPTPSTLFSTQSYLFGPLTGLLNHICLFGGCLFKMYVPAGGKTSVSTPAEYSTSTSSRSSCNSSSSATRASMKVSLRKWYCCTEMGERRQRRGICRGWWDGGAGEEE